MKVTGTSATRRRIVDSVVRPIRFCRSWKLGMPSSVKATTSPSSIALAAASAGPIAASSGYRFDIRSPRRLQSTTSPPSMPAMARTPSHLISYAQPSPSGGLETCLASIGSMKSTLRKYCHHRPVLFDLREVDSSRGGVRVLHEVTAALPEGASCVAGPSGSGKSTLLRLLNRLADPDSGAIRYRGTDVRERDVLELRREV